MYRKYFVVFNDFSCGILKEAKSIGKHFCHFNGNLTEGSDHFLGDAPSQSVSCISIFYCFKGEDDRATGGAGGICLTGGGILIPITPSIISGAFYTA